MKKRTLALLLAAVLVLNGLPLSAGAETPAGSGFDDVTLTAWYCKDVTYAHALGLVAGVSATEFAPLRTITRGEFVTILGRFFMALLAPSMTGSHISLVCPLRVTFVNTMYPRLSSYRYGRFCSSFQISYTASGYAFMTSAQAHAQDR